MSDLTAPTMALQDIATVPNVLKKANYGLFLGGLTQYSESCVPGDIRGGIGYPGQTCKNDAKSFFIRARQVWRQCSSHIAGDANGSAQ